MNKYGNSQAERFVKSIPEVGLDSVKDVLTSRCRFNFHYFQPGPPGQRWEDWDHASLVKLLTKLQAYSECSLKEWERQRVLCIYESFPKKSDFVHPKSIPHDVRWGRFRLEQKIRLAGFVVPSSLNGTAHAGTGSLFCSNTFYVVFLDKDHRFYITEKS